MSFKKFFFTIIFFVALFFIGQQSVFACSCAERPTVLEEFDSSDLVISAKVISVEKIREKEDEDDFRHIKSIQIIVNKVYKGEVKKGELLKIDQGSGSDCGWVFTEDSVGSEYLFYTNGSRIKNNKNAPQIYYVSFCGRSTGLKHAHSDLLYLDNLEKLRGKTRISGTISSYGENKPSPVGLKIKIIGEDGKSYTIKTDKNGAYEIYDLPAGKYILEPETPKGWKLNIDSLDYLRSSYNYKENREELKENQFPVALYKQNHADLDLYFVIDNAIRGKILSPDGQPMNDVCVKAIEVDSKDDKYLGPSYCTNAQGEFEIESVGVGTYIIVVNSDNKISVKEPFGRIFYPGVADRNKASVVAIEAGKFINDINIQIPKTQESIEISGKFLYKDGTPVADDWIEFLPSAEHKNSVDKSRAKTDAQGRFTIRIIKGISGVLSADKYVYESKYKDCPEVLKVIKKTGKTYATVKTNEVKVTGNENMSSVNLVLPFSICMKKD